jgi:hypothetical protein
MRRRAVHRRRWTLDDRAESVWHSLPVEVPAGCEGLLVTLEASDSPDVVIDLGCEGTAGWRGWSGGARRDFAITPSAATPGYVAGELEPGTWHVVVGLHRVPVDGVEVIVTAQTGPVSEVPGRAAYDTATATVAAPERPPRRELPAPTGMRWVACDFHSHTLHSDGSLPVAAVAALGMAAGLDALAITDHNTVSHHAELAATGRRLGTGLLPGQEVTTESGHANAFGPIGWVDFRRPAADWVGTVSALGRLLSVNHPLSGDCSWRQPLADRPPLAEVWHSSWLDLHWTGPIAWWQAWGADTVPIGGSDWHRPGSDAPPGTPTTWVCVDAAACGPDELPDAVLEGLRAGRTAISANRTAPVLLRAGDDLIVDRGDADHCPPLLVTGLNGSRHPVPGVSVPASGSGHVLIAHGGEVVSISR